jgi:predicted nuclease of predicted toxin-antitoxin system
MRLLLDENLPKRLKADFPGHEIFTVRDKGWNGIKNGELLQLMLAGNFNVLMTFDKNLQYQQNFLQYSITVFVLIAYNNTYDQLKPLVPLINQILAGGLMSPGPTSSHLTTTAHSTRFADRRGLVLLLSATKLYSQIIITWLHSWAVETQSLTFRISPAGDRFTRLLPVFEIPLVKFMG